MAVIYQNPAFLHTTDSEVGELGYVGVYRQNRPEGLKKPYEYVLPTAKAKKLYDDLAKLFKGLEMGYGKKRDAEGDKLQCAGPSKKSVSQGMRLNVFALGYTYGLCGEEGEGCSQEFWEDLCEKFQDTLVKYLGPDALIYAEPYSKEEKFEARFETYIMFKEMQ